MADQVLTRDGPVPVPLDYTVPSSGELIPRTVRATIDGTSAAASFYAVLQVIAPSGRVMFSAVSASIAAGASADVSWFPWRRGVTAAAPAPTPLGTLFAWYDFADTSTIVPDGSGNISTIADKTGNGHNAAQSTAAQRPAQTTVNGNNAGLFNSAASTFLLTGTFPVALSQPFTIACVFSQTIAAAPPYWPGALGHHSAQSGAVLVQHAFSDTTVIQIAPGGALFTALHPPYTQQMFVALCSGGSSYIRSNGVQVNGALTGSSQSSIVIGGQLEIPVTAGEVDYMDGAMCEAMYFEGQLTSAQLAATEAYLRTKWGTP